MIWTRSACAALVLLAGRASAQALPEERHEAAAHRPSGAEVVVLTRQRAAVLGATQGPDVAVAEAPREAASRARSTANPLVVMPATTTLNAGYRWGKVGAGLEFTGSVVQQFSVRTLGVARADSARALGKSVETGVTSAKLDAAQRALLAWVDALESEIRA